MLESEQPAPDQTVRQEWADRAAPWRQWATWWAAQTRAATDLILRAADVRPGWRVLDVASGGGEPALSLAAAVGPRGHVLATDLAPEMLDITAEAARRAALDNLTCQVADAQALPFARASFEAVTCRFGIALVSNAPLAVREIVRVLAPGGRTAFVSWGPRQANPFFTIIDDAFAPYGVVDRPEVGGPSPFTFATPGPLAAALRAAGCGQVHEATHQITLRWPGPAEQAWAGRRAMSLSCQRQLALLTPDQRDGVIAAVIAAYRRHEVEGRVALPAVVTVAWTTL